MTRATPSDCVVLSHRISFCISAQAGIAARVCLRHSTSQLLKLRLKRPLRPSGRAERKSQRRMTRSPNHCAIFGCRLN